MRGRVLARPGELPAGVPPVAELHPCSLAYCGGRSARNSCPRELTFDESWLLRRRPLYLLGRMRVFHVRSSGAPSGPACADRGRLRTARHPFYTAQTAPGLPIAAPQSDIL